jgi:hypothetical protein
MRVAVGAALLPGYVLLVIFLIVQSSYSLNIERPSQGVSDTVQFWFTPHSDWRVRTFAIDHDIHVHQIREEHSDRLFGTDQAIDSTLKNYQDVIDRYVLIHLKNPIDATEVARALAFHELSGEIEQSPSGLAFYNPDKAKYWSQSAPK